MNDKARYRLNRALNFARANVLYAPAAMLNTPIETLCTICNGCGAANAKFDFIPDRIYGTSIAEACHIHDFMYHVGRSIEDKQEADRVFLNNLIRLIERDKNKWYKPTMLQRRRALKYYEAVEAFGGAAFWAGKN